MVRDCSDCDRISSPTLIIHGMQDDAKTPKPQGSGFWVRHVSSSIQGLAWSMPNKQNA